MKCNRSCIWIPIAIHTALRQIHTQWVLPIPTICITYPPIPTIDLFTPTPSKLYHPTTCTVGTRAEWLPAEQICHRLTSLNSPPYQLHNTMPRYIRNTRWQRGIWSQQLKLCFQYHQDAMDSSDPRYFLWLWWPWVGLSEKGKGGVRLEFQSSGARHGSIKSLKTKITTKVKSQV